MPRTRRTSAQNVHIAPRPRYWGVQGGVFALRYGIISLRARLEENRALLRRDKGPRREQAHA